MNEFEKRFDRLTYLYLPHPRADTSNHKQMNAGYAIIKSILQKEFDIELKDKTDEIVK